MKKLIIKSIGVLTFTSVLCSFAAGCNFFRSDSPESVSTEEITENVTSKASEHETTDNTEASEMSEKATTKASEPVTTTEPAKTKLSFVDVFQNKYEVDINPDVKKNDYDKSAFAADGDKMTYTGAGYDYRLGIDVSKYNTNVDWSKVKEAGYDFAFIRIGFRGYGESGELKPDVLFEEHYSGAKAAGLDVGVYFFSQAVNEEEANEEAEYVLELLGGRELQLPVVFDPESILDDDARTDNVTGEQFTKNSKAFMKIIDQNGYTPAIYCNMLWEAFNLDLAELDDYPIWYADYEPQPQTPYAFDYWQYTESGQIEGVEGDYDLNIQIIK